MEDLKLFKNDVIILLAFCAVYNGGMEIIKNYGNHYNY